MSKRFLILIAALASCASPVGGNDLELSAGVSAVPGTGVTLGVSQRFAEGPSGRYDLALDWTRQSVDEAVGANNRVGDSLDLIRMGVRYRRVGWTARFGVAWIRAQGDPESLPDATDYGGAHFGVGYEFPLGEHLLTGPEVTAHYVDAEGTGDSGVLTEVSWRLIWKL